MTKTKKPKAVLDDIGKMAVTIHVFIDSVINSSEYHSYSIPNAKLRPVRKAVKKFLRMMKKSEHYDDKDQWGSYYYDRIETHLERGDDSNAVYLTWIQYQFHSLIKDHFKSYYKGCHKVKKGLFYESVLEMLLR